jgi:hypothetical protein
VKHTPTNILVVFFSGLSYNELQVEGDKMRKVGLLAIPLLVLMATAIVVLSFESKRPAEWRVELNDYIRYDQSRFPGGTRVQATTAAKQPWNFDPEMSNFVFGNSVFRTDNSYDGTPGGYIDLPFPPEQVWCVLLVRNDSFSQVSKNQIIFVAHHNDNVWWQDWVVHQGTAAPQTRNSRKPSH